MSFSLAPIKQGLKRSKVHKLFIINTCIVQIRQRRNYFISMRVVQVAIELYNNNNNNNDLLSTVSHHKKFTKQNKYNICDKRNRTKPKLIFKP